MKRILWAWVGATLLAAQTSPRLGPTLLSIFENGSPDSEIPALSGDVRRAVESRLAVRRAYQFEIDVPSGLTDGPERWLLLARQRLEAFLVSVLDRQNAQAEAVQLARSVRMFYEWEGDAGAPLEEAAYLEEYLREHSKTPLAPALNVLLLHRYRCAFEAAVYARDMGPGVGNGRREDWDRLQDKLKQEGAVGYRRAWDRLLSNKDPVIRAIADDLDAQTFLYQNAGGQHPRKK